MRIRIRTRNYEDYDDDESRWAKCSGSLMAARAVNASQITTPNLCSLPV